MLHTDAQQRIRITQAGFEKYTGQMGILFFEDGLSTHAVAFKDANRISAVMTCEFEDGTSCNPAQRLLDTKGQEAIVGRETIEMTEAGVSIAPLSAPAAPAQQAASTASYTVAQLEAVADDKGIAGLREISDPLGIKSNSIVGLIAELTKAGVAQKGE